MSQTFEMLASSLSQGKKQNISDEKLNVDSILFLGVKRLKDSVLYRECKSLENVNTIGELEESLSECFFNLKDLDAIETAHISLRAGKSPNGADVIFNVKEKNVLQFNANIENQVKSKPKIGVGIEVANRLGYAEHFHLKGLSTLKFSDPEFDIYASVPHIGINSGNIEARAFNSRQRHEHLSNVQETKNGVSFTHKFRNLTSVIFNGFFRNIKNYDNASFNTSDTVISSCGETSVTSVTLRHLFPFVDDLNQPRQGFMAAVSNEIGLPPGDTHFWKNRTSASFYFPLGRFFTLSLTGYVGVALPLLGASSIGIGERFFTENMVRGYDGANWGPKEEDDYVGGNVLLGGLASLRFPLFGPLEGQIFANAANVGNMKGSELVNSEQLSNLVKGSLASTGIGLVLTVGSGVLEFNFSHPLQGSDDHFRPWKVHMAFSPSQFA